MITIIERGIPERERPYEKRCGGCNTLFTLLRADAKYVADNRDGDYLLIKCPVCQRDLFTSL